MVQLRIEGINVEFPYEPYPTQIAYMQRVLQALQLGKNAALESPTGTGKTLSLLCACLAWQLRQHSKAKISALFTNESQLADSEGSSGSSQGFGYSRIIYTSRTHTQLQQVIRELNKTVYAKLVKVCILGSRDQTCINPELLGETNSTIKNHMCRNKVAKHECSFYENLERQRHALKTMSLSADSSGVPDIEDLVNAGRRHRVCPYYLARENFESADLLLLPYNYILDPAVRKANKIDVYGSILIFDEGHNLLKVCEESASFSFTTTEAANWFREVQQTYQQLEKEQETLRQLMDKSTAAFGQAPQTPQMSESAAQIETGIDLKEVGHMLLLLKRFVDELDEIKLSTDGKGGEMRSARTRNIEGTIESGIFLIDLLLRAGIEPRFRSPLVNLIDRLGMYLSAKGGTSPFQHKGAGMLRFASLLQTIYCLPDTATLENYRMMAKEYRVLICKPDAKEKSVDLWMNPSKPVAGIQLHYWCFSAVPGMDAVKSARSIIATSGTLTPLTAFTYELGLQFDILFSSDHVIKADQVWAGVFPKGRDGMQLQATFTNRNNPQYLRSLGECIVKLAQIIPQGVLVFFGSYQQMETSMNYWKTNGNVWQRLLQLKTVYVEPRRRDEFILMMNEYQNQAPVGRGAMLLAVCRGKISEGVDFSDASGRAVILTGIPFPPLMDPKVLLKQDHMDLKRQQTSNERVIIDGRNWYELEASRAVNQAVGRVIRHKDDFGAIILLDTRFSSWAKHNFSKWLQPFVKTYEDFPRTVPSLIAFYKSHSLSTASSFDSTANSFGSTESAFGLSAAGSDRIFVQKPKRIDGSLSKSVGPVSINGLYKETSIAQPAKRSAGSALDALLLAEESVENYSKVENVNLLAGTSKESSVAAAEPKRSKLRLVDRGEATTATAKVPSAKSSPEKSTKATASQSYMKELMKYLTPESRKEFVAVVQNYQQNGNLTTLIEQLKSALLPTHPKLFRGFAVFLHAKHQEKFSEVCNQILEPDDDD